MVTFYFYLAGFAPERVLLGSLLACMILIYIFKLDLSDQHCKNQVD